MSAAKLFDSEGWLSPNGGPRYLQLRKRIEQAIETGELPPDAPLPPEREIANLTKLSRVTVRKAVGPLVEKGLIVQLRGSGSFVAPRVARVEQSLSRLTSFTEDMARRGKTATSTWLERGVFMPSPHESMTLGLTFGQSVARLARLRSSDGTPLAIERASLSTQILPNPLAVETSLYEVLENLNNRPVRAVQRISATNLNIDDANLLGVAEGAAGLKIERVSYLPSGQVVELTKSLYRGDLYDFVADLQLADNSEKSR